VAVTFGQFLTRVGLCVLLVAGLGWGARGVLTASLVTAAAWAAVLAGRELSRGGTRVDLAGAREMLGFALPLLLCGVGFFVMNSGDRFFLIRSAGPRQVGVYALGYKLVLAVCMFTRAPLVMVWGARLFQVGKAADAPEVFGRAFTRMLAVYVFAGLGLCLLVNEAIAVAAGDAYADAATLVPPIALAYFFLAWADLMDGAFFLRRRSDLKTWVALGSTALMVGLYAVLIPAWGAVGAAWATLGGFAGHAALTRLFSQRVFAIRHESGRVGAMLTLAVGLWALSRLLPISAWAIPARVGLWALWPAVLWFAGVVSAEEKEQVRAALRWVPTRVRAAEPPYPPIRSRCEEPPLPSEV
jgi:O-antigen/teichoic acid export membrane protein